MHKLDKSFDFVLGAFEQKGPEADYTNIFSAAANPATTARPVTGLQLGL